MWDGVAGRSFAAAAPSSCSEVAAAGQSYPVAAPGTGSGGPRDSRLRVAPDSNSAMELPQTAVVELCSEVVAAAEPAVSTGAGDKLA